MLTLKTKSCHDANFVVTGGTAVPPVMIKLSSWQLLDFSAHGHYSDVIMGAIASQITSLMIVYSTVYSGTDQRKYQSSSSLAFQRGIHRWPVNSPHKWPVTRKMFLFDDVIMVLSYKCLVDVYALFINILQGFFIVVVVVVWSNPERYE